MNKITKKQTMQILSTKNNYLVYSSNNSKKTISEIQELLNTDSNITFINNVYNNDYLFRSCKKLYSNHIAFSNDSNLYFDNAGTKIYYTTIINEHKLLICSNLYYDDFDEINKYSYLIYAIK